jgi:hypothetical protein
MQENYELRSHLKRRDSARASLYRPSSGFTLEDASIVIGLCVSLLIVFVGALVFVTCFNLLRMLAQIL